jgi:cellulose synthase/poly-beta-1,6-N-acetylglucosamine synthase-like glycosyltransferase
VSVVVASHERSERLSILLGALTRQTFPRERWEVVVVHTYEPEVAARVLDAHELATVGCLRHLRVEPSSARPSLQRNLGWRTASGPLIAFTDDDCRPSEDWLNRLVESSRANPGAIVQGAIRPDPVDLEAVGAPLYMRTLYVDPPGEFTQTSNILYERGLLERIGGFDERAITGEDIDLALRAQTAGARIVGAPDALIYHAVEALSFREKVRSNQKWQHLAYIVKLHPELRRRCCMRIWWKRFRSSM